ncbi:hypothetical protein [Fluoribacter gormanii]|uniref:hypothetical protein n=1 Tax=Fluoribacter gormanii TaxID=464 RepID=UPI001041AB77|nr:hypothetical protein [Fluoribacter gormanii]
MYGRLPFKKKKYTLESVSDEITEAKRLLRSNNKEDKENKTFLELLELRTQDFEKALEQNPDPYERQKILEQYHRFAKTLSSCLSQPQNTSFYIASYHNNKNYYPVGVTKVIEEPIRHNISLAATITGAALILASIAVIWINPLITAILLPIGITMLAPGGASLLIPSPLDTSEVKQEEKMIFQLGATINKPELSFDETTIYTSEYSIVF